MITKITDRDAPVKKPHAFTDGCPIGIVDAVPIEWAGDGWYGMSRKNGSGVSWQRVPAEVAGLWLANKSNETKIKYNIWFLRKLKLSDVQQTTGCFKFDEHQEWYEENAIW